MVEEYKKHIVAHMEEENRLLRATLESIFGGKVKINFWDEKCSFWTDEEKKKNKGVLRLREFTIEDIAWDEDLLGVLGRLRNIFYVDMDAHKCDCEDCTKTTDPLLKMVNLNIEFYEKTKPNEVLVK
jgi:hypothetical protein